MHPTEDQLERFLAGQLDPAEQEKVARHLLAGCGICSRKLVEQAPERLLEQAADQHRKAARDSPRERALAAALEQDARWRADEKKLARSLELLAQSAQGYDSLTYRQIRGLHGLPLVAALRQRSWGFRFQDSKVMSRLAFYALKVADSLRPEEHEPALIADMRAVTWAELANAYKINDQYAEAEASFRRARVLLRQGSGDLRLLARVAELEASFRTSQRRLFEAQELFDRIYRIYLKLEDQHLAGQALIAKGINRQYGGRSKEAVQLLQTGVSLVDPDRDAQLLPAAQQSILFALADCSEYREAGKLLLRSGLRQSFAGSPVSLLKLRWAEGRILAGLGKVSGSERVLQGVHAEFLERGEESNAAFAGLDLLPFLLRQGKFREMRGLAMRVYGTFRDLGIRQEAAKAQRYLT